VAATVATRAATSHSRADVVYQNVAPSGRRCSISLVRSGASSSYSTTVVRSACLPGVIRQRHIFVRERTSSVFCHQLIGTYARNNWYIRGWLAKQITSVHCINIGAVSWKYASLQGGSADLQPSCKRGVPKTMTDTRDRRYIRIAFPVWVVCLGLCGYWLRYWFRFVIFTFPLRNDGTCLYRPNVLRFAL